MTSDVDDLQQAVNEWEQENPEMVGMRLDIQAMHRVVDGLVARRRELAMTQWEVARRMDLTQATISQFERESSDPRLSTLQRYARAVGLKVAVSLVDEAGAL